MISSRSMKPSRMRRPDPPPPQSEQEIEIHLEPIGKGLGEQRRRHFLG
jgi:hypothetical protein